jgi:tetratricopeptide (TPR) repeat protein
MPVTGIDHDEFPAGENEDPPVPDIPRIRRSAPEAVAERVSNLNPSGKTPLLDARPRVDELEHRFREDPEAAMEGIEELNRVYAPHPLVLNLMCVLQHRIGRTGDSLKTAREALPLCLERGATSLAAQVFALHRESATEFDLPRDTTLILADDLRRAGDLDAAEAIYLGILDHDRGDRRAVKGLLQIADAYIQITEYDRARNLYELLLHRCPDSPFAVHIEDGLMEAERRRTKAS